MWRELVVLGALAQTATAGPRVESASLGEHSIVVMSKKLAFVMTEENRVPQLVAVDLVTGKRRWKSTTAVKPIAARGNSLVALDGAGKVMVLDLQTGKKAKRCGAIGGIGAPFVDSLGLHQSAFGFDDGSAIYLTSTRDTHYAGGAAPSPEMEARSRSHQVNTWSIDLATCTAKTATLPPLPELMTIDATTDITTASGATARIERDQSAQTITLVLAKSKTPIDLTEGNAGRTLVGVSLDRRFVACAEPEKSVAMFDLDSGAVTHPAYFHPGSQWLSLGNTIVLGAGSVSAMDARNGKILWTIAERSTAYNGPYPPAARR